MSELSQFWFPCKADTWEACVRNDRFAIPGDCQKRSQTALLRLPDAGCAPSARVIARFWPSSALNKFCLSSRVTVFVHFTTVAINTELANTRKPPTLLHFKDFDFPPLGTSPEQPDSITNPAPSHTCDVMELPIGQELIGRPRSKMLRDCTPMWRETPPERLTLTKTSHDP
ncbi:hypothetical protein L596_013908 [Steinernema carpocapsae]|uniref:Uncharacterized protein n=1 Tax=Steinernema carpocapsae TaxID=34508 RepID=A0A4U5P1L2_STECR|nr:hypothetical protein L596_013908 [Steinernema carpocapsae]